MSTITAPDPLDALIRERRARLGVNQGEDAASAYIRQRRAALAPRMIEERARRMDPAKIAGHRQVLLSQGADPNLLDDESVARHIAERELFPQGFMQEAPQGSAGPRDIERWRQ